jgi:hypothetical protein
MRTPRTHIIRADGLPYCGMDVGENRPGFQACQNCLNAKGREDRRRSGKKPVHHDIWTWIQSQYKKKR